MDPTVKDRRTHPILGIAEADQPIRSMTIPGIEGQLPAKILSTTTRGASTRMVRVTPDWGSGLAGAFTADVEIFVLKGELSIGRDRLTDYEYAAIPQDGVIGGFHSAPGAVALLMTANPIRYDTSRGGAPARLVIGRPSQTEWRPSRAAPGVFARPVATSPMAEAWIGSSTQNIDNPFWHRHTNDEECFVLDGEVSYLDLEDVPNPRTGGPGTYFYWPAGTPHITSSALKDDALLTFHRALGEHETETIGDVEDTIAN